MPFRSAAERRWWTAAAAVGGAIFLSLYPLQFAIDRLRERNLLRKSILASGALAAVGWLDEGIQGLLPNRHYDLRDVALNAFSGTLAIASLAPLRRARERDRRTRSA